MKKMKLLLGIVLGVMIMLSSCKTEPEFRALFNGENLDNWDTFLGRSLGADFDSLAQAATVDGVFSVVDVNGEKLIRISGEINGSLATQESFENYHLRLVYRWGDVVYSRRNSGLLYHSFGDFGVAIGTWMPNIECQLMHENLGDTYLMANTTCETSAAINPETNQYVYTPGVEAIAFGEHANGRMIRKSTNSEMPLGEWNTVDLYCYGRTAVHVVNGVTVMVNTNTGVFENGEVLPLTAGKIQLQSEGAELFVKSIDVKPIKEIPGEVL
jgi:hypothetical protein